MISCIFVSACTSAPVNNCKPGQEIAVHDSIYFGTGKKEGFVTQEEWSTFLDTTVAPRFPEGLTVSSASGQWRGADGEIIKEHSYVLTLVHPETENKENTISEIINTYKNKFQQEAVLRVKNEACISF